MAIARADVDRPRPEVEVSVKFREATDDPLFINLYKLFMPSPSLPGPPRKDKLKERMA
jgi:hypothetical protein